MVKHLPHHLEVNGLSLTAASGTCRGNGDMIKRNLLLNLVMGSSTVVEHLPHNPKVKGSILASAFGTWRAKMA